MRKDKILCRAMLCILLAVVLGLVRPVQAENLKIGGTIDVDLFGYKHKGDSSRDIKANSSSDIKLDALELSIQSELSEHVSANALVKYEYEDADYKLFVDEAYVTLTKLADQPLTIKAGKWSLPFGVFNNHLANDPLTKDAYEINAPAVSFAFTPDEVEGLDLSLTAYSNKDALLADPNDTSEDDLGNYILNATLTKTEFLTMSVYFDSEAGAGDRNNSLGASLSFAFKDHFSLDAEYIEALERDAVHPKDSAYSVCGAFKVLPSLELVARFEGYDDGENGTQDFDPQDPESLRGVEYRASAGANYELVEHATLIPEFRYTGLEDQDVSNISEWILRLRVEF